MGLSEKLLRRYFGPYRNRRRLSEVTYEVERCDPTSKRCKSTQVVHVLRMKPYLDPADQLDENTSEEDSDVQHPQEELEDIREDSSPEDDPQQDVYNGPITRSRSRVNLQTVGRCSSEGGNNVTRLRTRT